MKRLFFYPQLSSTAQTAGFAGFPVSFALVLFCLLFSSAALAQSGFVTSGGKPIPGATITATQGSQTYSTVTDRDGHYGFPVLGTGQLSVTVEMFGFDPL